MADSDLNKLLQRWSQTLAADPSARGALHHSYRPWQAPAAGETAAARQPSAPFIALEMLGRGGMGEVVRARQTGLQRDVALKRLRPDQTHEAMARRRFLAEAVIAGRLEHPNIVPVYELGHTPQNELFLAMKLVDGRSWRTQLASDPAPTLHESLEILLQVSNAVAFAHSRGIVHNDLKPANVMLAAFGEVLVLDWGLAVSIAEPANPGLRHKSSITTPCGTPRYMPPELALGQGTRIGPWTDVYLLGAILHELLYGRPPHGGERLMEVLSACLSGQAPECPASAPALLRALCRQALDPSCEARPDLATFQQTLRNFQQHRESRQIALRAEEQLAQCAREARSARPLDGDARHQLYEGFATALAGFVQAARLWPQNPAYLRSVARTRQAYGQAALACGDLGLAASQLAGLREHPDADSELRQLQAALQTAQQARVQGQRSRRRMRLGLALCVVLVVCSLAGGLALVHSRNQQIESQQQALAEQTSAIAARNQAIERERQHADSLRVYAERRGAVALEALDALAFQVQDRLLERGSAREHALARELLEVARDGWQALRQADLEHAQLVRGSALTQLRSAELDFRLDGDVLRYLDAAHAAVGELRAAGQDPEALLYGLELLAEAASAAGQTGLAVDVQRERCRRRAELPTTPARSRLLLRARLALSVALGAAGELGQAVEICAEAGSALPTPPDSRDGDQLEDAILVHAQSAKLATAQGHSQRALQEQRLAVLYAQQAAAHAPSAGAEERLGTLLHGLCELEMAAGSLAAAASHLEQASQLWEQRLQADPANVRVRWGHGQVSRLRAALRVHQGDLPGGLEQLERFLEVSRELFALDPDWIDQRQDLDAGLEGCADLHAALGDGPRALAMYEERSQLWDTILKEQPGDANARQKRAQALRSLGELQLRLGQQELAGATLSEALALLEQLCTEQPGNGLLQVQLAASQVALGQWSWAAQSDADAAWLAFSEGLRLYQALQNTDPSDVDLARAVGEAHYYLAALAELHENWQLAEEHFQGCLQAFRLAVAAAPQHAAELEFAEKQWQRFEAERPSGD